MGFTYQALKHLVNEGRREWFFLVTWFNLLYSM